MARLAAVDATNARMKLVRRLAEQAGIPYEELDANRMPSPAVEQRLIDEYKWKAAQARAAASTSARAPQDPVVAALGSAAATPAPGTEAAPL
eukprot:3982487-Heterocapsa_arctica.AAC.1